MALVTEIPARPLCTLVPRLLGVRMTRSLGSVFGFSTLAKSSPMSCAEGSPFGELVRLLGVCMMDELGPGLSGLGIFSSWRRKRRSKGKSWGYAVGLLREKITCGRVWATRMAIVMRARCCARGHGVGETFQYVRNPTSSQTWLYRLCSLRTRFSSVRLFQISRSGC